MAYKFRIRVTKAAGGPMVSIYQEGFGTTRIPRSQPKPLTPAAVDECVAYADHYAPKAIRRLLAR